MTNMPHREDRDNLQKSNPEALEGAAADMYRQAENASPDDFDEEDATPRTFSDARDVASQPSDQSPDDFEELGGPNAIDPLQRQSGRDQVLGEETE